MDLTEWSKLALICILGAMSPGPSLVVILKNSIEGGLTQGFFAGIGHGLGMSFYALIAVFGLVTFFENIPQFSPIIQIIGSLFLIFLGTKMIITCLAKKIEKDFEIGDEVAEEIKIEDFGRRAIILAKQTLIQRVKDLEKEVIINKYVDLVGEIITGEIYQVLSREVLLVDNEGNEISLPRSEQIYKDKYRKGDTLRGVVTSVEMFRGNPKITLSRTSPMFLEQLFEKEVPEITDGLITINKVVREPGERAKICVESYDDRIDPVGACVGMNGSRIHSIVRELQNENIDYVVQINGRKRASVKAKKDLNEENILNIAKNEKLLDKYLKNKSIKKIIFVKNRLINILVNE